ncbi:methyltransferase domain-containing protein [candidate division KSB1 bacterium]
MKLRKIIAILLCLFLTWQLCLATAIQDKYTLESALNFFQVANTTLLPVYGPLAEQIVTEYNLAEKEGIGIDLGSGPGNLIIELCKKTRRMQWINADINPNFFPLFLNAAEEAGVGHRVNAVFADAQELPFEDNYADIIVSRGSFQFWKDKKLAFSEVYRVLQPGGVALIGRGFSKNLPLEIARKIRNNQNKNGGAPKYDIRKTADELQKIMQTLGIKDYRIRIPKPTGSEGVNYGIWLEFHKPVTKKHRLNNSKTEASENSYIKKKMYVYTPETRENVTVFVDMTTTENFSLMTSSIAVEEVMVRARRLRDVIAEPMQESVGLETSTTIVNKSDIRKQGAKNIIDALKYVSGAWIESRGRKVKRFFSVRGQKYPSPSTQ